MKSLHLAVIALALSAPCWAAPQQAAGEVARGQQLFAAGRYSEAERAFAAACEADAGNAFAWNMLGSARHVQKAWNKAVEAFERADRLLPDDPRVLTNLGVCYFDMQDVARARTVFERVVALDPGPSRPHFFLARIAVAQGDAERAEREFALALRGPSPEPIAPFHQGLFFLQQQRLDDAQRAFERALELLPDLPGAHMNLGLVLQRKGDSQRAHEHLARFRELQEVQAANKEKKMRVGALVSMANDEIEAGRYEGALPHALAARDAAPEWPLAYQMLSRIYTALGRKEDAEREMESFRRLMAAPAKQ